MRHPARAAEDLPIHHHRAGALENRLQARFQCSRRQHRLEHRPHRIALQRPVQKGAVLCLQAVGQMLRVVARHTDTGAHRRCGGIQHQNAAVCHGTCCHCLHRPLHRAGDGQLHAQRPAIGLQKLGRLPGAQRTLRRHGANKTAVLPCAGKYSVQRLFQPGSAMTRAVQIAQQVLTQRHCGIPPGGGVTGQAKTSGVAVHLQQKRGGAAAATVQKRLSGGIGAGIQAVVIALPGKAHHLPALLKTGEQPPLRIIKVAPPGGQLQGDRALRRRPCSIGGVQRQQIQPAQHHRKPQQQGGIHRQYPFAGHEATTFPLLLGWAAEVRGIHKKRRNLSEEKFRLSGVSY